MCDILLILKKNYVENIQFQIIRRLFVIAIIMEYKGNYRNYIYNNREINKPTHFKIYNTI